MSNRRGRQWPWRPFTLFGLGSALLPGFLFGVLMGSASLWEGGAGGWYPAVRQAHGHALLVGWAGSVIMGVGLHFLPRLRGARLVAPRWVPWLFVAHASGVLLRTFGQPIVAVLLSAQTSSGATGALKAAVALGAVLELLAALGTALLLVLTFRGGPPLVQKKGFVQIWPLLATAGLAWVIAQSTWLAAVASWAYNGDSGPLLPERLNDAGADILLLSGFAAISFGMSARLFPMTFRRAQASMGGLRCAAACLLLGVVATAADLAVGGPAGKPGWLQGIAAGAFACGLLSGVAAARIFQPPPKRLRARSGYRLWRDPAGVGVVSANAWVALAAALLLAYGLSIHYENALLSAATLKDMARHAMGSGFLSMLILSVGWTMLPGFGGGQPRGGRWMGLAIVALNGATALRLAPGALSLAGQVEASRSALGICWAVAGVLGVVAIGAFAWALRLSWAGGTPPERSRGA